jgi:hypothetical protein
MIVNRTRYNAKYSAEFLLTCFQTAGTKVESARTESIQQQLAAVEASLALRRWLVQLGRSWLLLGRLNCALGVRYGSRRVPPHSAQQAATAQQPLITGKPRPMEAARLLDDLYAVSFNVITN